MTLTRRQAHLLLAASAWTLYVWISRLVIMAGADESFGFKAVHAVLALVSLAFAVVIGRIGLAARRASRPQPGDDHGVSAVSRHPGSG